MHQLFESINKHLLTMNGASGLESIILVF